MHVAKFGFRGLRKLNHNFDLWSPEFSIGSIELWDTDEINIVVGANGSGKSTIGDLIAALSDVSKLGTIARENTNSATSSGFKVVFRDGSDICAEFSQVDKQSLRVELQHIDNIGVRVRTFGEVDKSGNISGQSTISRFLTSLDIKVNYRSSHDEKGVPGKAFISKLNAIGSQLVGLAPYPLKPEQPVNDAPPGSTVSPYILSNPIMHVSADKVSVWVNDDQLQGNEISISLLPSGWRAYGGLTAWLETVQKGSICVIEEPETHIHPSLLRILIKEISEIRARRELQLFVATHSPIFLDSANWGNAAVRIFQAKGHVIHEMTSVTSVLRDLGARPSDYFMSNGIIWVEGASDRLYINYWLRLWCEKNKIAPPVENVDYSFAFYGGAMLSHFCGSSSTGMIDMFKQNQNSIILIDRDLDFVRDKNGKETPRNLVLAKAVIYAQMLDLTSEISFPWITYGYTIESYLPYKFRKKYFQVKCGRLLAKNSGSKVRIYERYASEYKHFDNCFNDGTDLEKQIRRLHKAIACWRA